jgi:parallel beta-helix repeat protein
MGLIIKDPAGEIKATVGDIRVDRSVVLAQPLPRDLAGSSLVINAFPLIDVNGHPGYGNTRYSHVIVEDLKLDGNKGKVQGHSWLHSALTFWNVEHSIIRNVWIDNSSFEGISDQGFHVETQNHIFNNLITNSRGNGIHVGTGYSHNVIENNTILNSGGAGIYFCLAVRNNLVLNNAVIGSALAGIGGIDCCYEDERNGDYFNLIVGNTIERDGKHGISIEGAKYNVVYQNKFVDNGGCAIYSYNGADNYFSQNALIGNACAIDERVVDVPHGNQYFANVSY